MPLLRSSIVVDINGTTGNDTLDPSSTYLGQRLPSYRIFGKQGNDWLHGGTGADIMTGGSGIELDEALSKLSPENLAKLAAFLIEWEREGQTAFDRLRDTDPAFYMQLAGLTNADIRRILEKARSGTVGS